MKIAIIGQQDFGKTVLEAFLDRGDEVAAVFCAPEKEGARPDALRAAAEAKGLTVSRRRLLGRHGAGRLSKAESRPPSRRRPAITITAATRSRPRQSASAAV